MARLQAPADASRAQEVTIGRELSTPELRGVFLPLSSQLTAWMHQEAEGKLCSLLPLGLLGKRGHQSDDVVREWVEPCRELSFLI